jgi:hypothetical protein
MLALVVGLLVCVATPDAALVVQGTGVDDATLARVREKASAEVEATGQRARAVEVPRACIADPRCLRDTAQRINVDAFVVIEVVRAGRKAQVAVRLFDERGGAVIEDDVIAPLDEVRGARAILADNLRVALTTLGRPPPAPPPLPPVVVVEKHAAPPAPPTPAPVVAAERSGALTWTGAVLTGVGVAAGIAGVAVAVQQVTVFQSASSLGDEKERAQVLVPTAIGVAALGVAAAIAGGVLLIVDD